MRIKSDKKLKLDNKNFQKLSLMEEIIPWTYMCVDLIEAVKNGDVQKVEELIKEGADVNTCDAAGSTLLWNAYINDYHEIVFILLSAGADVNLKTGNMYMCDLHRACAFASLSFVEILLACEGNVNIEDINGKTPLILSVEYRYTNYSLKLIELLIEKGAKVNHQDCYGLSVMHYACQQSRLDAIELLIKSNGDPCLQNSIGFTPLTYALLYICYTSPDDMNYEQRLKIADKLLNAIDYDYKKIKSATVDTCMGPNLHALFDLIFYAYRTKRTDILNMGWKMFSTIKYHINFDRDLNIVARTICQNNRSNYDVIYFLSNMQITDVFELVLYYIQRLPYKNNIDRANILFYYCFTIDNGKSIKSLIKAHDHLLIQQYVDVIELIINSNYCKIPSSLKCQCRTIIRKCIKYSIKSKLSSLLIPKDLKNFLLFNEINSLIGANTNALLKLFENL